ncbi:MAG: glycosyltransferase [Eubacteriales bacterium]|nr:glycosyltransferase [Eubacteriales bacterium]
MNSEIEILGQSVILELSNGAEGVVLKWKPSPDVKKYVIYRREVTSNLERIAVLRGSDICSYIDSSAESGLKYVYEVKAYKNMMVGFWEECFYSLKNLVKYKPGADCVAEESKENAIIRLSAPVIEELYNTSEGVVLKWKQTPKTNGYNVYRKMPNGRYQTIEVLKGAWRTAYTDETAVSGKKYIYKIKAFKGASVSAEQEKSIICLSTPVIISIKSRGDILGLEWEKTPGANGYNVYRKKGTGKYERIAVLRGEESTLYEDVVQDNISERYTYQVKAFRGDSVSETPEKQFFEPSVTIVIPTYRQNNYIDECIESVLNQDYPKEKIEIILSVNGDDLAYAESLKKKYKNNTEIRVIHTRKKGAGRARNFARKYLHTEYVAYLDDDDRFSKGFLKELTSYAYEDVSIVCGCMTDVDINGKEEADTYINRTIMEAGFGIQENYLSIGALFSTVCCKLYKTDFIKNVAGDFDESLNHTEDVAFWVDNIYKVTGKIATCYGNSGEAYLRRLTEESRSRPDEERRYEFNITDRIMLIKRFSSALYEKNRDIQYKEFVISKIHAMTKGMKNFFDSIDDQREKERARTQILASDCRFLNKSLFGKKKGIAFCHNFAPYVDASAYVASKRLGQISAWIGDIINWTVVNADMSKQSRQDSKWDRFFARIQYSEKITLEGPTYFNEEVQYKWGHRAYESIQERDVDYIYSRSMWIGSHVAALLYKKKHPETYWIAEFSDPIYMGVDNQVRPASRQYEGELAFLNTFWKDIETLVCDRADAIIFTNQNQRTYMLEKNEDLCADSLLPKSLVWNHPVIPSDYADIITSDMVLNPEKVNVAYFGTFYKNRNYDELLLFLNNSDIDLHIFTKKNELLDKLMLQHENLYVHDMVSHLEVLNLANRMDYCYLNDVQFEGNLNPYLPSKLADYLSADTKVIALVNQNSPLSQLEDNHLIKIEKITHKFVKNLKKIQ